MSQQHDITDKMRAILVDWLIEVHYKFELMEETLYLTINLIDRFLEHQTVSRKKLQLVGMTAMLLACKYEEVFLPIVDDFIVISVKAYTKTEVLDMEKEMVNTLQFNLSVPTPYVFNKRECSKMMVSLHQRSGTGKLVSVFNKYGTSKSGHVARTQPANFMLYPRAGKGVFYMQFLHGNQLADKVLFSGNLIEGVAT